MKRLAFIASTLYLMGTCSVLAKAPSVERDTDTACGKSRPIAGYSMTFQGEVISLPSHVTIKRDGETIYADSNSARWEPPYTSARYAVVGQTLLLLTQSTDCIDMSERQLFVLRKGAKPVRQPVWTSNWKDGFFVENGRLHYWSEWFCNPDDKSRKAGMSYVYSFSEQRQLFERLDVPTKQYCSSVGESRFITFRDLPSIKIRNVRKNALHNGPLSAGPARP